MRDLGFLLFGILIVAAVLSLTAAIYSVAPYVAGAIVIIGLLWIFLWSNDTNDTETTPD